MALPVGTFADKQQLSWNRQYLVIVFFGSCSHALTSRLGLLFRRQGMQKQKRKIKFRPG